MSFNEFPKKKRFLLRNFQLIFRLSMKPSTDFRTVLWAKTLFLSVFLTACFSVKKEGGGTDSLTAAQVKSLDLAGEYTRRGDFEKAGQVYDSLALELKGKPFEAMALFHGGWNRREAGDCDKALARYRRLLDRSVYRLKLKAGGLLEISFVYECLGQTRLSFLSLKDVGAVRDYLSPDFQETVYPARLGIAYAGMGAKKKGERFKTLALSGVFRLEKQNLSRAEKTHNLSRLFYLMGRSYVSKKSMDPEFFILSFPHHRLYLLRSVFLEDGNWSVRARGELKAVFEKLEQALASPVLRRKYKRDVLKALKEEAPVSKKESNTPSLSVFYETLAQKIRILF